MSLTVVPPRMLDTRETLANPAPEGVPALTMQADQKGPVRLPVKAPARAAAAAAKEPRIVIENVAPSVDDGRFAAKRIAGESVTIEADIFTDGHPLIAAEILYRADDEDEWQRTPMPLLVNDRWSAAIRLDRIGKHRFLIEAWLDQYGAFARDLKKKVEAQKDIAADLQEGRQAIELAIQHADARLATVLSAYDSVDDVTKVTTLLARETVLSSTLGS